MSVSLYVKLNELHKNGTLELKRDPVRHKSQYDLGAYHYQDKPIQVLSEVVQPENKALRELLLSQETPVIFDRPHDIAWCPAKQVLLAYSPTDVDPLGTKEELLAPPIEEEVV